MEPDLEKAEHASGQIEEAEETQDAEEDGHSKRSYAGSSNPGSRRSRSTSRFGSFRTRSVRSPDPSPHRIDPENPGPWVLHHHKPGLILELQEPEGNFFSKMYDKYFKQGNKTARGSTLNERHDDLEVVKTTKWKDRRFRVNFAELQRMHLRKLQCKLLKDVVDMHYTNRENEGWEETLEQYSKYCPIDGMI